MPDVDGFVLPVPKKNLAACRRISRKAGVESSWNVYQSRALRDRVNARVMKDPLMACGGFTVLVDE